MSRVFKSIVWIAALIVPAMVMPATAVAGVGEGDRAAEFNAAARDSRGRRVRLKSYRNKVVVMTFGASWCKPCKKELPAWEKLAKKYRNKGVVFLAVNIDKDLDKGKRFVEQAGLRVMRAVYDPGAATAETYDPPTMPSTYVIGRRGIVRYLHPGYRPGDEKKLAKLLDELLAKYRDP
ncbi:MAG: TlpA family protein disulfide reductase [Proteobacteria bacterium]|nr:TlpA family protein disulfide reductase [Pseudomonadota bacterium]